MLVNAFRWICAVVVLLLATQCVINGMQHGKALDVISGIIGIVIAIILWKDI